MGAKDVEATNGRGIILTRREMLQLGAAATVAMPDHVRRTTAGGETRPNILLLMADQFRADCVGAAGNRVIHTPNLDRIAREGVLFTNAYSCAPTCTPARAALLTGLSPWRHGVLGTGRVGETYPIEMPRVLRDAGYYTVGIGKMHWHPQRNTHGMHKTILDESGRAETPEFRSDYRAWLTSIAPNVDADATGIGWNDYRSKAYALPEEFHPTYWTGVTAVAFLETYDRPEPFFLKVSFARPHSPYDPPKRFMNLYKGVDLPVASLGQWAERYAPRSDDSYNIWHGNLGPAQVRSSREGYYGSVTFLDETIGRILKALKRRGLLEKTLILFTADHGDMLGDHHLWRKSYAYESSAAIPMVMRWPEMLMQAKRGQVLEQPVELRDVLPTFMDAASLSGAEACNGRSLLSLARDARAPWRDWIDLEHDVCYSRENHWNALTDGHRKYIFHAKTGEEQFFDLERDPHELYDCAKDAGYAGQVAEWRGRLIEHLKERGDAFVKDGSLVLRPEPDGYSPNYPGCKCHEKQ